MTKQTKELFEEIYPSIMKVIDDERQAEKITFLCIISDKDAAIKKLEAEVRSLVHLVAKHVPAGTLKREDVAKDVNQRLFDIYHEEAVRPIT